jgi:hypothetical protein
MNGSHITDAGSGKSSTVPGATSRKRKQELLLVQTLLL